MKKLPVPTKIATIIWNKHQLMSRFEFYLYIAGSLHVSGPQAHPQESSHNHWFSVCKGSTVSVQAVNQWLCEQLYELS